LELVKIYLGRLELRQLVVGSRGKRRDELQALARPLSRMDEGERKLLLSPAQDISRRNAKQWRAIYDQELSRSYQAMPISPAASSQTQIGSSPFSNFRQRLSQSIMGTKQVKVEETD
jgi:hypothetical protein